MEHCEAVYTDAGTKMIEKIRREELRVRTDVADMSWKIR